MSLILRLTTNVLVWDRTECPSRCVLFRGSLFRDSVITPSVTVSLTTGEGLDFSVDTTNFVNGEEHNLQITVIARYGSSQGTLRYTFRFRKQVTSCEYKSIQNEPCAGFSTLTGVLLHGIMFAYEMF